MKIVKEFDHLDFFERHHYLAYDDEELKTGYWRWGLGENGELYCQCSTFDRPNGWYLYEEKCYEGQFYVLFSDMRRIVKEFGHLVVFT